MTMLDPVGIVGVGIMGHAIAKRLLGCGTGVVAFDVDGARTEAAAALGAVVASSPGAAADGAAFVILSLPHAAAVETAVFGDDGVASAGPHPGYVIDMSSISPADTRRFAERLAREGAGTWIDCPLSGGAPGVATGNLSVMVGGTVEDLDAIRPIMDMLASNITRVGPTGAGQAAKLVNQLIAGCALQALAEAVVLARLAGVDVGAMPGAMRGGRADSRIVQEFMPMMASGDHDPTGTLTSMVKDFANIQSEADRHEAPLPLFSLTHQLHRLALAKGLGAAHNAAIVKLYDDESGRSCD